MEFAEEYRECGVVKKPLLPWVICLTSSFLFFYSFIQGTMFASIADNIMHDFNIQADKMTYLSSMYYLSNVIFLFVAGMLLDRFSTKKMILMAMLLCVFSTFIFAYAHSFYLALMCRFVAGIGSAFCFIGPIRIASRWFPPKRMALVTGAIVTMAMTGGMLAQYPLTKLVAQIGWRDALLVVAWLGVAMFVGMIFCIKDRPGNIVVQTAKKIGVVSAAKKAYLNPQTLLAALYASVMNMAVAVFGAMMGSLYLMQRLGVDKEDAAIVNSMLFLGAIIGGPVIGWCSDKIGLRILPMKLCACAAVLVFLVVLYVPISIATMAVLFFLLGFFTASQVISYALVAESSPLVMTATAVSTVSILTQGGYILYQNLFSKLLMWHGEMQMNNGVPVYSLGDYQIAAIIFPLGLVIALWAAMKLKETHCHQVQG